MVPAAGVRRFFSDPNVASLDEVYQHLGGHVLGTSCVNWKKSCSAAECISRCSTTKKLSAQIVTQYVNVKQRQLI